MTIEVTFELAIAIQPQSRWNERNVSEFPVIDLLQT